MELKVTIDLDSLMCKLSDVELCNFMLETFRDRVSDESHVNLVTEMFKTMYDADQEKALDKIIRGRISKKFYTIPKWISVKKELPPVDKEVMVFTSDAALYFGHIVDKRIAKDYNGWNIPNVEYWLPFINPK